MKRMLIVIAGLSLIGTALVYGRLPDTIAMHWNAAGQVDRMESKAFIWLTAALPFVLLLLSVALPKIDPRKDSYQRHARAFSTTMAAVALFLVAVHWILIMVGLGLNIDVSMVTKLGMGLLFIVIGNFLPQAKPNYTYGIRLPWTLADATVWKKVHRIGAYGFVALGAATVALAFFRHPASYYLFITGLIGLIGFLAVYSWRLYSRLHPDPK